MNECGGVPHDFSLISDISTLSDEEDDKLYNSVESSIKNNNVASNESAFPSEFSNSKQVRFNSAVAVSSLGKDCTAFDGDVTISDEKDDFTIITPDPNGNHDYSFKLDYTNLDSTLKGCDIRQSSPLSSLDCSYWFESHKHSTADQSSPSSTGAESTIRLDTSTFFRTRDHLPRIPIHETLTSNSSSAKPASNPDHSIESARNESDASIPRPHLRPLAIDEDEFSLSSSLDLTSKGSTTFSPSPSIDNIPDVPNLSEPKLHVAHVLAEEIETLKEKLETQTIENPSDFCHQEAERMFNEACSGIVCSHNANKNWVFNPHVTVNIPENAQTYTNLMDLSVDESEIVRQERARISRQRKRMAELRRKSAKDKVDQPEPDLLEFFDPNRHVFQSINLHSKKSLNFLPSLSRAPDDFVHVFEENLASELSRLM